MALNPFVPPGHEACPDEPLDPVVHAAWYRNEGGHGERFDEFRAALAAGADRVRAAMNPPPASSTGLALQALTIRGRLVIVEGSEKSGKTTLLRRCAAEVERHIAGSLTVETVDLRGESSMEDGILLPRKEFQNKVCRMALQRCLPDDDDCDRGATRLADGGPRLAFDFLRHKLPAGRIVQFLLPAAPPQIDVAYLGDYLQWTGPSTIFYAERTIGSRSPALAAPAVLPGAEPPLVLRLRPLTFQETKKIVDDRTSFPTGSGLPVVDPDVFTRLPSLNRSDHSTIGGVVSLFRDVFARRISGDLSYPPLPLIEFAEVTYLLARGGGEQL